MGVSCKRVGCRVPATTTVIADPPTSTVTLVDVEAAPMGITLCAVHATAVTAPMNWVLVDDRGGDLRLLPGEATDPDDEAEAPAAPEPAPRRPRRRRAADERFAFDPPAGPQAGGPPRPAYYRSAG